MLAPDACGCSGASAGGNSERGGRKGAGGDARSQFVGSPEKRGGGSKGKESVEASSDAGAGGKECIRLEKLGVEDVVVGAYIAVLLGCGIRVSNEERSERARARERERERKRER